MGQDEMSFPCMLVLASAAPNTAGAQTGTGTQVTGSGVCARPARGVYAYGTTTDESSTAKSGSSLGNIDPTDPSAPILATAAFSDDPDSTFSSHFIADAQAQAASSITVTIGFSGGAFFVKSVGILPGIKSNLKITKIDNQWQTGWTIFVNNDVPPGTPLGKMFSKVPKYTGTAYWSQIVNGKVVSKGSYQVGVVFTPNALKLCVKPTVRINNMARPMITKINAKLPKSK